MGMESMDTEKKMMSSSGMCFFFQSSDPEKQTEKPAPDLKYP